jgi:hypothetical protein
MEYAKPKEATSTREKALLNAAPFFIDHIGISSAGALPQRFLLNQRVHQTAKPHKGR